MTTGKFSATEWKQLVNAPQLIHHVLAAADRGAFFTKRSEAKALDEYLSSYRSPSALVQSIIAGQKDADEKIKASRAEAQKLLEQVGTLLETKVDEDEGDAVREFLMNAGEAIAKAASEQAWAGGQAVSGAEEKTMAAIATALKATEADKRRRKSAAAAAAAVKRAKPEAKAKAKPEDEAEKKEAEAREKRQAEARKQALEARARRKAEAEKKAAEQAKTEREAAALKQTEEIKKKRAAQAKAAEDKARREAEQLKREALAMKREAEAIKHEAETVKAAGEQAETFYVVKSGDTLSGIAKSVYGKAGRWREIFEANKDIIENPNLIRPGWKLRIP